MNHVDSPARKAASNRVLNPVATLPAKLLLTLCGVVALYGAGVVGGFLWARFVIKNPAIHLTDVALFRWRKVRHGIGSQQFEKANAALAAKDYQAAYLSFVTGLRNDPNNVAGRLAASQFFLDAGLIPTAVKALEEGLDRNPEDSRLAARLFDLLLATGRERRALELLHRMKPRGSDEQIALLRGYEVQATLALDGPAAARALLAKYPELERTNRTVPVVARVWWESQERLKATELMAAYVATGPEQLAPYAKLVEWYLAAGLPDRAEMVATAAGTRFSGDVAARALAVEVVAERSFRGPPFARAVETYLADFRDRPEAINHLALLAGRKGWLDFSRALLDYGSVRLVDSRVLALAYCDALVLNSRLREAHEVLEQLDRQSGDGTTVFMHQLRQRQVLVAAALGDAASARDAARRLASVLRPDPQRFDATKRLFEKRGIKEAVAEFTAAGSK